MERRNFVKGLAATGTAGAVLGPDLFRGAWAARASVVTDGPFGAPTVDTGLGFTVPEGFSARVIAVGNETVPGTDYRWHVASDGAGTFATPDGGFILVSNSEVNTDDVSGGASAIRFGPPGPDGIVPVVDAYRVLGEDVGTPSAGNCAGGVTPWGTWFSAEENVGQQIVWECDPTGATAAIPLPQFGIFQHEAGVVDPERGIVYLTEDSPDARFFRWVPDVAPAFGERPDFSRGTLQVAAFLTPADGPGTGPATWMDVDAADPSTYRAPGSTSFIRGEGIWYHDGVVYWVASTLSQIYAYDTATDTQEILHDPTTIVAGSQLNDADNLVVHHQTGDLFITEDPNGVPGIDIMLITAPDDTGARTVSPFLRVPGGAHAGSELTGPVFDPSGTRFYFSSQRQTSPDDPTNTVAGVIYEVTGPFDRRAATSPGPASPGRAETAVPTSPSPSPDSPDSPDALAGSTGGATLPATGGGALTAAGLGVGAVGWWLNRQVRRANEDGAGDGTVGQRPRA